MALPPCLLDDHYPSYNRRLVKAQGLTVRRAPRGTVPFSRRKRLFVEQRRSRRENRDSPLFGRKKRSIAAMPIYEYICRGCKHEFEVLVRGREKPACPSCGSAKLEKKLSVPARTRPGPRPRLARPGTWAPAPLPAAAATAAPAAWARSSPKRRRTSRSRERLVLGPVFRRPDGWAWPVGALNSTARGTPGPWPRPPRTAPPARSRGTGRTGGAQNCRAGSSPACRGTRSAA